MPVIYALLVLLFAVIPAGAALCPEDFAALENKFVPEDLAAEFNAYRGDPTTAPRAKAFDSLVKELQRPTTTNLKASAKRANLPPATLNKMRAQSAGVITIEELFSRPDLKGVYALGLSDDYRQYVAVINEAKIRSYHDAYLDFDIDWLKDGHTGRFMHRLVKEDKPFVMLIPNDLLDHPAAGITRREFLWLMEKPERMKNAIFVFGAYDFVSPKARRLHEESGADSIYEMIREAVRRKNLSPAEEL